MRTRRLGDSDLRVSEIALGSWLTYAGGVDGAAARDCVHAALDAGINLFDTANEYGRGAAEERLAECLAGTSRDRYLLATKVFFPMSEADRGLSAAQIRKQLDASLLRLRTDYIDLYQCHRYDETVPLDETMSALEAAVRAGKVRWVGFSEWTPAQILAATKCSSGVRFVSSQPQYSMLWRKPEAVVFPVCTSNGIGQIVWSPLGQGMLSGKYRRGEALPRGTRAASVSMGGFIGRLMTNENFARVEKLRGIAQEEGISLVQLALAWVLRDPRISSAIVGATTPAQVVENASASGLSLSAVTVKAIDEVLG